MSDLDILFFCYFVILGACLGSFANVLAYRLPRGFSILGRSRCSQCYRKVPWYFNIPVFSFLYLRGKCGYCREPFSVRYPTVEIIVAGLFGAIFYKYQWSVTTTEYFLFIFALITASVIDLDFMILPDELTLSGIAIGLVGAYLNPDRSFLESIVGVLAGGGSLWLVAYIYFVLTGREGLGGGDIKLLAWIGAVLGWKAIPFVILCSSVIGSVVGILISRGSKSGLKTVIPFGPFLSGAAILYLIGLKSIGLWYVQLFFVDF